MANENEKNTVLYQPPGTIAPPRDLLARLDELTRITVSQAQQNAALWRALLEQRVQTVAFASTALAASTNDTLLTQVMETLGVVVRADRLALFNLNPKGQPVLIAGYGKKLPSRNEVIATEEGQAMHIMAVWTGAREFKTAPVKDVGFDSFWGIKNPEGTVIAVLGVDDTGEAREFTEWEQELMRTVVGLLSQLLNN